MGGWGEAKAREAAVAARVQAKAGVAGESSRGSLQEGGGICIIYQLGRQCRWRRGRTAGKACRRAAEGA